MGWIQIHSCYHYYTCASSQANNRDCIVYTFIYLQVFHALKSTNAGMGDYSDTNTMNEKMVDLSSEFLPYFLYIQYLTVFLNEWMDYLTMFIIY